MRDAVFETVWKPLEANIDDAPSAPVAVVGSAALAKALGATSKSAANAVAGGAAVVLAALAEPAPIADALTLVRSCAAADAHLYIVTSGALAVSESEKVGRSIGFP